MGVKAFRDGVSVNVASTAYANVVANVPGRQDKMISWNFINVTGDNASAWLDVYTKEPDLDRELGAWITAGSSFAYIQGSTTGFTANDKILLQTPGGTVTYALFAVVTGASQICFGSTISAAHEPGTRLFKMDKALQLLVGSATKELYDGGGVFVTPADSPVRFAVTSSGTNAAFHGINGRYV